MGDSTLVLDSYLLFQNVFERVLRAKELPECRFLFPGGLYEEEIIDVAIHALTFVESVHTDVDIHTLTFVESVHTNVGIHGLTFVEDICK